MERSIEVKASKATHAILEAVYDGKAPPLGNTHVFLTFIIRTVLSCIVGENATEIFGIDIEYLVNYLLGSPVLFIKYFPDDLANLITSYYDVGMCIRVFDQSARKQLETISVLMHYYKISPPTIKSYGDYFSSINTYVLFNNIESRKIGGDVNVIVRCQDNRRAQQEHGRSCNSFCEFSVVKSDFFKITSM